MIKPNESELAIIDFEIPRWDTANNSIQFSHHFNVLSITKWIYLWNCMLSFDGVFSVIWLCSWGIYYTWKLSFIFFKFRLILLDRITLGHNVIRPIQMKTHLCQYARAVTNEKKYALYWCLQTWIYVYMIKMPTVILVIFSFVDKGWVLWEPAYYFRPDASCSKVIQSKRILLIKIATIAATVTLKFAGIVDG